MFRLVSLLIIASACNSSYSSNGSYLRNHSNGSRESQENISAYEKSTLQQEQSRKQQNGHQDELVATCVARNKVTRQVYAPVVNLAAIAKIDALMNCVEKTVKGGLNPYDCEIAACPPLEPPQRVAEIIARLLEEHFPGQTCE